MLLATADFPFLEAFGTIVVFFAWAAYVWTAIQVFIDVFRRTDISGWGKVGWVIIVIILPFLGVLIYLLSNHEGLAERNIRHAQNQKAALDQYVRETAGGTASEIAKAKELLDAGTITQAEFDAIKAKTLAA